MVKPEWAPYAGEAYLSFEDTLAWCEQAAAANPGWVSLTSIGATRHGRPIPLLTIGAMDGATDARPAFWLDGGTHAAEWTGVMAALFTASRWIEALRAGDEATMDAFRRQTAVIVPCICPDGMQALFEGAPFLRSTLRPPREGTVRVGLDPVDLDGDGAVRWMRWRHPAGPFAIDPEQPMFMRPRTLDDDPADAWFLCQEGMFIAWDGVRWVEAPRQFGLDLNRNFPGSWQPFGMFGMDGGDFALSEPESRAVVDAFRARPGVAAALSNHTYTGAILTQPYRDPSPLEKPDIELLEGLARHAVDGTGYRVFRVVPDFSYDPKQPIVGVWSDTVTTVFGVPGYTLELWDPFAAAGVPIAKPAEFFTRPDAALIRKVIAHFCGDPANVSPWRAFDHPQLGAVEIGGFDYMRTVRNPPVASLAAECERGYRVADRLRRAVPRLEGRVTARAAGPGATVLEGVWENLGFLPTSALDRAEALGVAPGIRVTIDVGEGVQLVEGVPERDLGHLDGWGTLQAGPSRHAIYPGLGRRGHRARATWVLAGQGTVVVRWACARAGCGEVAVQVG